jgi:leucyl/phenylalanyl-tRNA---protein transferase
MLDAYRQGIFPWFSDGEPILWWCPDPRMVLFTDEFKRSRSLRKVVRQGRFEIRVDSVFARVIDACAAPRSRHDGTWITAQMKTAYCDLHQHGEAHSVECWREDELVGGLYGVAIGRMFFGESMFARETDASKVALDALVQQLQRWQFPLVDCQMDTPHLASLGARPIAREQYLKRVEELVHCPPVASPWVFDPDIQSG